MLVRVWLLETTGYFTEFTFRVNHREMQNAMFDLLIGVV
jgi:hypothetical protein